MPYYLVSLDLTVLVIALDRRGSHAAGAVYFDFGSVWICVGPLGLFASGSGQFGCVRVTLGTVHFDCVSG